MTSLILVALALVCSKETLICLVTLYVFLEFLCAIEGRLHYNIIWPHNNTRHSGWDGEQKQSYVFVLLTG
jgi:hypothetical protein